MPAMWVLYSIIAAVLWGLDYAIAGKLLEKIQFSTLLTIEFAFGLFVMAIASVISGSFKRDILTILSSNETLVFSVVMILVFNIAHVFIVLSIANKNATLAGLIEISYPLFIALFSLLLFRESNMTLGSGVGGAFIFLGVSLIYLFTK
jgi:drug/metabolite transporter (DMT)-like permease